MRWLLVLSLLVLVSCQGIQNVPVRDQQVAACKGAITYVENMAVRVAAGEVSVEDAESFRHNEAILIQTYCQAGVPVPDMNVLSELSSAVARAKVLGGS